MRQAVGHDRFSQLGIIRSGGGDGDQDSEDRESHELDLVKEGQVEMDEELGDDDNHARSAERLLRGRGIGDLTSTSPLLPFPPFWSNWTSRSSSSSACRRWSLP